MVDLDADGSTLATSASFDWWGEPHGRMDPGLGVEYLLIETVVARDGSRTVVQIACDSAGRLDHHDPKFP